MKPPSLYLFSAPQESPLSSLLYPTASELACALVSSLFSSPPKNQVQSIAMPAPCPPSPAPDLLFISGFLQGSNSDMNFSTGKPGVGVSPEVPQQRWLWSACYGLALWSELSTWP